MNNCLLCGHCGMEGGYEEGYYGYYCSERELPNDNRFPYKNTRYKRNGVLHGNKKFQRDIITIDGRKFSIKELKVLISRINKGEKIKDLAQELKVDIRYLSNAYYYHRTKVISQ